MVDKIVVLTDGQISEVGSYDELLGHNGEFAQFLKEYLIQEDQPDSDDPESKCFSGPGLLNKVLYLLYFLCI